MEMTKLSTKGQIILPKTIRDAHQWTIGMEFNVEEVSGGVLLSPAMPFPATDINNVIGCLKYDGKSKTIEEMNQAILEEATKQHVADDLHLTNRGKATEFVTFDGRLVKRAKALSLGFVKQAR